ncbi:MAG: D-glycero-beta-D-manno-heptose 1-phosphate adenylyltransferase [Gemmatimonadaceae bacterium]|nr:D-glycero-beta-D-manno-heptose 1-phosphate adenylyltransferase [Gemmatimonadaceae bacterium]
MDPARKIIALNELKSWRANQEGSVVFTNGVFDLLHPGHIDILTRSRALGDALIVGLNTDSSVKRLKGESRPVRSEAERAYVLAGLEAVDRVVLFDEDTPIDLINAVRPDVIAKGGDYSVDTIVGSREVKGWGGRVEVIPLTPGQSTTSIIQRLRDSR